MARRPTLPLIRKPALLVAFLRSPRKAKWAPPGSCIVTHQDYVATGWTLGPEKRPGRMVYDRAIAMAGGDSSNWVDLRRPAQIRKLCFDWCDTMPDGAHWAFWVRDQATGVWAKL